MLTRHGGDVARALLAYALLFAAEGAPMLYYGDEIGMVGENDPGCRGAMVWDETRWSRPLLDGIRELAAARAAASRPAARGPARECAIPVTRRGRGRAGTGGPTGPGRRRSRDARGGGNGTVLLFEGVPMNPRRVTMQDVAERAGVSKTAVSLALNDSSGSPRPRCGTSWRSPTSSATR